MTNITNKLCTKSIKTTLKDINRPQNIEQFPFNITLSMMGPKIMHSVDKYKKERKAMSKSKLLKDHILSVFLDLQTIVA